MITFIQGKVIKFVNNDKGDLIDVLINSGIAYRMLLPTANELSTQNNYLVGDRVEFYTSFQVREASQTLYGFDLEEKRDFFEKIINVSGIGPKIGIAVLSTYSVSEVKKLVEDGDYKGLSKVSGLGAKGAQKIIVEMKGKFEIFDEEKNPEERLIKDLKDVLESLGFKGLELTEMVDIGKGIMEVNNNLGIEQLTQSVLRNSK